MKSKKIRHRVIKAANSPMPDPTCGHGGCGLECSVRYVGPTSHMRDHHIVHAARGAAHVWTAAIVTGFALVLTGSVAYTTAQGLTERRAVENQARVKKDLALQLNDLNDQLAQMKKTLAKLSDACIPVREVVVPKK